MLELERIVDALLANPPPGLGMVQSVYTIALGSGMVAYAPCDDDGTVRVDPDW
jgi:hypothetical protein